MQTTSRQKKLAAGGKASQVRKDRKSTTPKSPAIPGYYPDGTPRVKGQNMDGTARKKRTRAIMSDTYIEGVSLDLSVIEDAYGMDSSSETETESGDRELTPEQIASKMQIVDEKLDEKLDLSFKKFLLQHMQFELFKEITLERALIAYCAKKRKALKLADDVKLELNWKVTVDSLGQFLKEKFLNCKDKMILAIETDRLTVTSAEGIQRLDDSKKALGLIEKSIKRKINNIVHSLLSKICNYWHSLNENLGQFKGAKTSRKSVLFETKARYYDILTGATDGTQGGNDIDGLLLAIKNTETDPEEMRKLKIVLENKDPDCSMPLTQNKIDHYLVKAGDNAQPVARSTVAAGAIPGVSVEVGAKAITHVQDPLVASVGADTLNLRGLSLLREFSKTFFDGICEKNDGDQPLLCLKPNCNATAKNRDLIKLLQFLIAHQDASKAEKAETFKAFKASELYSTFHSNFYIPFSAQNLKENRDNTMSDGYCFYRAAYQLFLRYLSDYKLSVQEMKDIDRELRHVENEKRKGFFDFLGTMVDGVKSMDGDSAVNKLKNARLAFFKMNGPLSQTFWGCLDWVATLHQSCSGFGVAFDPELKENWKRFWCSSILQRKVSEVGSMPSFAEIDEILSQGVNFLVHHVNHFFPYVPATQVEMHIAYEECCANVLFAMTSRMDHANHRKGADRHVTDPGLVEKLPAFVSFAEVLTGILTNDQSIDFDEYFTNATLQHKSFFRPVVSVQLDELREVGAPVEEEPVYVSVQEKQIHSLRKEVSMMIK